MKRLLLLAGATRLLLTPIHAQTQDAQTQNHMSAPEFRQVLVDLGTYLDAHKGTNLASQFASIPDAVMMKLYPAFANPGGLQSAVAALKQHDADLATKDVSSGSTMKLASRKSVSINPLAAFPSCTPNTIIDNSSGATCTPAYPDSTNSAWRAMAGAMIPVGIFAGVPAEIPTDSDYAAASQESCDLTHEVNLEQVQAGLNGAVDVGQFICAALVPPDPLAIACYVAIAAIGAAGETDAGLYTDCLEQDGLINAAEIDAGFHNTVTIYNRLQGVDTHLTNVDTDIDTRLTNANTEIDNRLTSDFSALGTQLTNVDNHIAGEFTSLAAQLNTLISQLSNQVGQGDALLGAELKQIMKMQLEPDGLKKINPAILTCTGTNCPDVLANCPAAGCSWNNVGPLP